MNATQSSEIWIGVPGYEGLYEASDLGRVRSLDRPIRRGQILKQAETDRGYRVVSLSRLGKVRQWRVHRLVALAFLGEETAGMEVCHNNGIPYDNRLCNLRYDSHSNNQRDQAIHGTHKKAAQTHCLRGHEFSFANTYVTKFGQRSCRTCHRHKVAERRRITGKR
ncbi:hypothetical protein CH305_18525 [Rhodococcus sp. 15-649-2-2]|uniref:NUMOD4 domain-containing protein n=1 Tax=Rhodococcus sp. 15-649-2-2 TaxID=2023140 RepID=UPI000B9BB3EA|nr:hypothetical protein CH305_18525 [Rhodococcus sp. 15-649-2-2]